MGLSKAPWLGTAEPWQLSPACLSSEGVSALLEGPRSPSQLGGGQLGLRDSPQRGCGGRGSGRGLARGVWGRPGAGPGQGGRPRGLSLGPGQPSPARSCSMLRGRGPGARAGRGLHGERPGRGPGAWAGSGLGGSGLGRARGMLGAVVPGPGACWELQSLSPTPGHAGSCSASPPPRGMLGAAVPPWALSAPS